MEPSAAAIAPRAAEFEGARIDHDRLFLLEVECPDPKPRKTPTTAKHSNNRGDASRPALSSREELRCSYSVTSTRDRKWQVGEHQNWHAHGDRLDSLEEAQDLARQADATVTLVACSGI